MCRSSINCRSERSMDARSSSRRTPGALQILGARDGSLLELAVRLFEALDLGGQRARPLDQCRVRRLGFGGAPRLVAAASRASNSRRCAAPAVRRPPAVRLDPLDRLARLLLARLLGAQLLFGAPAFDGDLLLLARNPVGRLAGVRRPAGRSRRSPSPAGAIRTGATRSQTRRAAISTSSAAVSSRRRASAASRRLRARAAP